jgi:glycosyltransferase involved in cell wall biosynthesis
MNNEKLKILIISTNGDLAGAPIHTRQLIEEFSTRHDVSAIYGEVAETSAAVGRKLKNVFIEPGMRSRISPWNDLKCCCKILKIAAALKPGVIHAHSTKAGMIARIVGVLLNTPVIYTVHGWGFGPGRKRLQSIPVWLVECLLARIGNSFFVFVSRSDQHAGRLLLGIPEEKGRLIYNGMKDPGLRADPGATQRIVMTARVGHQKDHDLLLRAIAGMAVPVHLLLVGAGTDAPEFVRQVQSYVQGTQHRLECLGPRHDIPEILANAGIFVLTSRYEGLPMSIIEAMSAGLPIVATDVGGVRELVTHGDNGFLVRPGSVDDVRDALTQLCSAELRSKFGAASRKRYEEQFREGVMTSKLEELYTCVNRGNTAPNHLPSDHYV